MGTGGKIGIYIVSKGRWESRLTSKYLDSQGVDYLIAVEPQEYDLYAKEVGDHKLLKLPFSNLGIGSTPARNYCWEHSMLQGQDRHLILDDNISGFSDYNAGKRTKVEHVSKAIACADKLMDGIENLAILGFGYTTFAIPRPARGAFILNAHCYSALLIRNSTPYRWRLKYNEDIDLCLQVLNGREKMCTLLLEKYTINKISTSTKMKGGNQTELYKGNAEELKYLKAKSIQLMWPDDVSVASRYGRPHHYIDWKKFKNKPIIKTN